MNKYRVSDCYAHVYARAHATSEWLSQYHASLLDCTAQTMGHRWRVEAMKQRET
jgi:hypothetical protein